MQGSDGICRVVDTAVARSWNTGTLYRDLSLPSQLSATHHTLDWALREPFGNLAGAQGSANYGGVGGEATTNVWGAGPTSNRAGESLCVKCFPTCVWGSELGPLV